MESIFLNIYGYRIAINVFATSEDENRKFTFFKNKIEEDFFYFLAGKQLFSDLEIKISRSKLQKSWSGILLGKTRMTKVYQLSLNQRYYLYKKGSDLAELKIGFFKNKKAEIFSENSDLIYEILYILILSSSGEYLDYRGLVRIHAMGMTNINKTIMFYGARGAGKSTLYASLSEKEGYRFFSDEICLLDIHNNLLKPFPVRIALSDQALINLDSKNLVVSKLKRVFLDEKNTFSFNRTLVSKEKELTSFIKLSSISGSNTLSEAKNLEKVKVFFEIVLGLGLIQMVEFLIRIDNIYVLVRILKNRFLAYKLICKSEFLLWNRSGRLPYDIGFICDFIGHSGRK